jgi:hypothetical protein
MRRRRKEIPFFFFSFSRCCFCRLGVGYMSVIFPAMTNFGVNWLGSVSFSSDVDKVKRLRLTAYAFFLSFFLPVFRGFKEAISNWPARTFGNSYELEE